MIPSASDFRVSGTLSLRQRGAIAAYERLDGPDWQRKFLSDIAVGQLVPLRQGAQLCDVSRSTMHRRIYNGRIDCVRSLKNTWWVWPETLRYPPLYPPQEGLHVRGRGGLGGLDGGAILATMGANLGKQPI